MAPVSYAPLPCRSTSSLASGYEAAAVDDDGVGYASHGSSSASRPTLPRRLSMLPDSPIYMLRRTSTRVLLALLAAVAIVAGLFTTDGFATTAAALVKGKAGTGVLSYSYLFGSSSVPFYGLSSATALPPALSTLPESLKRITLVGIWAGSNDKQPDYLNNFFRSAALNNATADLLVIHVTSDMSKCLDGSGLPEQRNSDGVQRDFGKENSAWDWEKGGNIRIVCQSRETHLAEEAAFLCDKKDGWNCDEETHNQVVGVKKSATIVCWMDAFLRRLHERADEVNVDFKPMRGAMYKRYFIHPENPIWAWCDMDMHLGRLEHLPFPIISSVSMLSMSVFSPTLLYLTGQLSIFNNAAPGLSSAWKNYKPLASAEAFINPAEAADGGYAGGGIDETWLSAAYLRDGPGEYAGTGHSWAVIPDVHGQDLFIPGRKFVISGIDVLEVDARLNRKEIEAVIHDARTMPVDEYGGWHEDAEVRDVDMSFGEDCIDAWFDKNLAQCVNPSSLTLGDQFTQIDSVRRATIVRIGSDPSNALHMRLERDRRPRRWQRKLFLHYQELKRQDWWWKLPPWFIGDNDEVMEFDWKEQTIWRMGEQRDENLWHNVNKHLKEDGSADHVIDVAPKEAYKTSDEDDLKRKSQAPPVLMRRQPLR